MIRTETARATSRSSSFSVYAWGVLVYNILVVLWGAYVRATGSGAGCGNHWPACNGQIIPRAPQAATIIEFTHRATSGLALVAVVALIAWAFRGFPPGHIVRRTAALSGVFIVTEALIGAALVRLEHVAANPSVARGWSLSLHLINTFMLLAVLALTAWWSSRTRPSGAPPALLVVMLLGLVVLGISGAIAALGDTLFPVTSIAAGLLQDLSSSAHVFVRLRVFHPVIAILVALLVVMAALRRRRPDTERLATALIILVIGQLVLGAMNLAMLAPVAMQLLHLAAADAVWVVAVLFTAAAADR